MQNVFLRPLVHRNQEIIGIVAPYDCELTRMIRKLPGIKWSQTHKLWYLPLSRQSHSAISSFLQGFAVADETQLKTYLLKRKAAGTSYSARSLQEVMQATKQKAGVLKPGSVHLLRHGFATS